jgi:hypothetical protein
LLIFSGVDIMPQSESQAFKATIFPGLPGDDMSRLAGGIFYSRSLAARRNSPGAQDFP